MRTIEDFKEIAINIQDACNPYGVVTELENLMRHLRLLNTNRSVVLRNSASRLMIAKLADMAGIDFDFGQFNSDLHDCMNAKRKAV